VGSINLTVMSWDNPGLVRLMYRDCAVSPHPVVNDVKPGFEMRSFEVSRLVRYSKSPGFLGVGVSTTKDERVDTLSFS